MSKNLIVIFIIIAVIATLGWIFLSPIKESPAVIQIIKKSTTKQPQNTTIIERKKEEADQSQLIPGILPYNEQFNELKNLSKKPFLSIESKTLENIGPVLEDVVSVFTNPEVSQPLSTTGLITVEQQVFDILYPDYFTDGLAFTQSVFVEQGFLSGDYKKIENFDSEEKIFVFVNTNINVFEEIGFITKSEADKFRVGANKIWKNILEGEKLELKKQLIGSEFYKRILTNRIYYISKSVNKKIAKILKELKDKAFVKTYAADCYRGGAATPGGSNVWAPCCNCGLKFYGYVPVPVGDCGYNSRGCDIPLGCKNLYGKGRAVIWDPSGICGVG
jgi:hypothetical protein